jgi:hypothetical protein
MTTLLLAWLSSTTFLFLCSILRHKPTWLDNAWDEHTADSMSIYDGIRPCFPTAMIAFKRASILHLGAFSASASYLASLSGGDDEPSASGESGAFHFLA